MWMEGIGVVIRSTNQEDGLISYNTITYVAIKCNRLQFDLQIMWMELVYHHGDGTGVVIRSTNHEDGLLSIIQVYIHKV